MLRLIKKAFQQARAHNWGAFGLQNGVPPETSGKVARGEHPLMGLRCDGRPPLVQMGDDERCKTEPLPFTADDLKLLLDY
jgi:hypothetical protein